MNVYSNFAFPGFEIDASDTDLQRWCNCQFFRPQYQPVRKRRWILKKKSYNNLQTRTELSWNIFLFTGEKLIHRMQTHKIAAVGYARDDSYHLVFIKFGNSIYLMYLILVLLIELMYWYIRQACNFGFSGHRLNIYLWHKKKKAKWIKYTTDTN